MYRLIIADDEPLIREGLLRRNDWNALGYEVAAVLEDGEEILDFLEKERVDVLLTDIRMFRMSGLKAAEVIAEKYPWMRVVLISGYRKFEYATAAMHCGVYEYLLKPVDFDELRRVFTCLRAEMDGMAREAKLLRSFGEAEYDQLIALIRAVSSSVLDSGEEAWLPYARMKPLMRDAPEEVRQMIVRRLLGQLRSDLQQMNIELAADFGKKFEQLGSEPSDNCTEQLSELLKQLSDEVNTLQPSRPHGTGDDVEIHQACKYIHTHLSEDFSYRDVANFIHLSPRHFIRRFRQEMGETFTDYLIRVRMDNAMKLLSEGLCDVSEVCRQVGYRDEKYFRQLFKKYAGCSVREYAQRHALVNQEEKGKSNQPHGGCTGNQGKEREISI